MDSSSKNQKYILQLCHGYDAPFLDCARQYSALFQASNYRVVTVFLTGKESTEVKKTLKNDVVIFLDYANKKLKGLKLGIIKRLKAIIKEYDFSASIAHRTKPTYLALVATNLPVFSIHHAFGDFDRLGRRLFINAFKSRVILFGVSDAVRDDIRRQLPNWPEQQILTFYNRIDVADLQSKQFERHIARERLGLEQDALIIGNVGRLHPDKDQKTLIKAFHIAKSQLPPNTYLIIIGEGKLKEELSTQIRRLNLENDVLLLGRIPNAMQYFKAFDIFVLSSNHEPFGMVLLEAMAASIPIICSNCGGGPEIIDKFGVLFPFRDEKVLATQLLNVISSHDKMVLTSMKHRLNEQFSDEAAREYFWKLDCVKSILG